MKDNPLQVAYIYEGEGGYNNISFSALVSGKFIREATIEEKTEYFKKLRKNNILSEVKNLERQAEK